MDKCNIQTFLMISATFFALNASARPTQTLSSANSTQAVSAVVSAPTGAQDKTSKS